MPNRVETPVRVTNGEEKTKSRFQLFKKSVKTKPSDHSNGAETREFNNSSSASFDCPDRKGKKSKEEKKKLSRHTSIFSRIRKISTSAPAHNHHEVLPQKVEEINGFNDRKISSASTRPNPNAPSRSPSPPALTLSPLISSSPLYCTGPPPPRLTIVPGETGILNHGNTCFVNAVVQCLSHVDPLARYLLIDMPSSADLPSDGATKVKMNGSVVPRKRELTESFASFLASLWQHTYRDKISLNFKSTLGTYRSEYRSRDQQDAQEFLLFLLNTLHDELNQATPSGQPPTSRKSRNSSSQRPVLVNGSSTPPQANGVSSRRAEMAGYIEKNRSPVYSLCAGFQSSTLRCPSCSEVCSTLEPYLCLSLPIPITHSRHIFATYVQHKVGISRHAFLINTADTVFQLRSLMAHRFGIPPHHLLLVEMTLSGFGRTFLDTDPVADLLDLTRPQKQETHIMPIGDALYAIQLPPPVLDSPSASLNSSHYGNNTFPHSNSRSGASSFPNNTISSLNGLSTTGSSSGRGSRAGTPDNNSIATVAKGNGTVAREDAHYVRVVVTHVEQNSIGGAQDRLGRRSDWSRFTAPYVLQVPRHQTNFSADIMDELSAITGQQNLRSRRDISLWIVDGIKGKCELGQGVEFPLINDCVDRALNWNESGGGIRHVKICVVWLGGCDWINNGLTMERWQLDDSVIDALENIKKSGASGDTDAPRINVTDCLQSYLTSEQLSLDEAWRCPKCRTPQQAIVKTCLQSTPDLLIVQLKRFKQSPHPTSPSPTPGSTAPSMNGTNRRINDKLEVMVHFPVNGLNLANFVDSSRKSGSDEFVYDLVAVCNHFGTLSGGHYTASCRSPVDNKWRRFNDDKVDEITEKMVPQQQAYILFYLRRRLFPCPPSSPARSRHWSYHELEFPSVYILETPPIDYPMDPPKSDPLKRKNLKNQTARESVGRVGSTLPREVQFEAANHHYKQNSYQMNDENSSYEEEESNFSVALVGRETLPTISYVDHNSHLYYHSERIQNMHLRDSSANFDRFEDDEEDDAGVENPAPPLPKSHWSTIEQHPQHPPPSYHQAHHSNTPFIPPTAYYQTQQPPRPSVTYSNAPQLHPSSDLDYMKSSRPYPGRQLPSPSNPRPRVISSSSRVIKSDGGLVVQSRGHQAPIKSQRDPVWSTSGGHTTVHWKH